ncbi:phosphoesterase [candidate division KSB1 bacterium]
MSKHSHSEEYVLVFPAALLHQLGCFNGINPDVDRYLDHILDPANHEYMNRKSAEKDPSFKQLIPYMIIQYRDTVFAYRRGKLMGEKRLHGNYSIGIGGHISVKDPSLFGTTYDDGMKRELSEEVAVKSPYSERRIALINDDSNDVGKVHFGVVHVLTLEKPDVTPKEKSINEAGFWPLPELLERRESFETWSQICIDSLDIILSQ